jgi:hypothetical protein
VTIDTVKEEKIDSLIWDMGVQNKKNTTELDETRMA